MSYCCCSIISYATKLYRSIKYEVVNKKKTFNRGQAAFPINVIDRVSNNFKTIDVISNRFSSGHSTGLDPR